jgi:uncharacterized protein (DUF302 family)
MTTRRPTARLLIAFSTALALIGSQSAAIAAADPTDASATPAAPDTAPSDAGMVVYKSAYPFSQTLAKVQEAAGKATTIDFARTASWIGKELRPTTLVIGSGPAVNAPILAANQKSAIDLPQRYLVWQAAAGTVFVAYNSAEYIASCGGIDGSNSALDGLRGASAAVATAATGSSEPVSDGSGSCSESLIQKDTTATVPEAIARYQSAFELNSQPTVMTVDDAAEAAGAGAPIPQTQMTMTDDASISVALVGAQQSMAIDLPLRFIAWEDDAGKVRVANPDIKALASRHHVSGQDSILDVASTSYSYFTSKAAGRTS